MFLAYLDIDSLASCLYRWALVIPSCGDVNRRDWKRKVKAKVVIPRSLAKLWRRYHVRTCTYPTKSGRFLSLSRVSVAAFSALRDVKKSPLRNGLFPIHLKIYLLKMRDETVLGQFCFTFCCKSCVNSLCHMLLFSSVCLLTWLDRWYKWP